MSRGEITGFVSEPVRKITVTLASGKTVVEYHTYPSSIEGSTCP